MDEKPDLDQTIKEWEVVFRPHANDVEMLRSNFRNALERIYSPQTPPELKEKLLQEAKRSYRDIARVGNWAAAQCEKLNQSLDDIYAARLAARATDGKSH